MEKQIIRDAASKQKDGTLTEFKPFSVNAENIPIKDGSVSYSLQQFYDDYRQFITQADFIVSGEEPTNQQYKLWIDTSSSNLN